MREKKAKSRIANCLSKSRRFQSSFIEGRFGWEFVSRR
jgi:hypothetical protein